MPNIDTVIFDLDGTLINSRTFVGKGTLAALEELFRQKGEALPPVSEGYILAQLGKPIETFYRNVLPQGYKHWLAEMIPIGERHLVEAIQKGEAELFPHAVEVMEELKGRGVRMGIASNCGLAYLENLTRYFGLDRYAERAYCLAFEPSKTAMVKRLLREFNSKNAVMVGDRYSDIEAAHDNEIPVVAFTQGFGSEEEIREADYKIGSLVELLPLLQKLSF